MNATKIEYRHCRICKKQVIKLIIKNGSIMQALDLVSVDWTLPGYICISCSNAIHSNSKGETMIKKCEAHKVTQYHCQREAITARDTGKIIVHLCAKCDAKFGNIVGNKADATIDLFSGKIRFNS